MLRAVGGEGGIRTLAPVTPAYSLSRGAPYSHLGTSPYMILVGDKPGHAGGLAEREGFEPPVPFDITGFQDRLLKPLRHLSELFMLGYYSNKAPDCQGIPEKTWEKGRWRRPSPLAGCRKSGLRHFFEVFIAPLRLRRGQGAMQGNPCYARLSADLTRTPQGAFSCPFGTIHLVSPNPIKASGGCGPRTPGGFSTGQKGRWRRPSPHGNINPG